MKTVIFTIILLASSPLYAMDPSMSLLLSSNFQPSTTVVEEFQLKCVKKSDGSMSCVEEKTISPISPEMKAKERLIFLVWMGVSTTLIIGFFLTKAYKER